MALVPPSPESRFLLEDHEPAYLQLARTGELTERAAQAVEALGSCAACPRACEADRLGDARGECATGRHAWVASAFPHHGEEDVLRGWRGSGTVFFSRCNLRCVFCQNADTSQRTVGRVQDAAALAATMLRLQRQGCHNINLVSPSHVVPQVLEAVALAAAAGLYLPLVYNSSAYDALSSLHLLDGVVDVYMPDFKVWHPETGRALSGVPDYPRRAREALMEMHRQVGVLRCGPRGLACRGLLVRHLVMPGQLEQTGSILAWLAEVLSADPFVNLMGQYRPAHRVGVPDRQGRPRFGELDRRPTPAELRRAARAAERAGIWRLAR